MSEGRSGAPPEVAVVIVTFRNVDDASACLEALAASAHADFEVVICENGGEVAWRTLKTRLPERLPGGQPVRILLAEGNLGFAGGVNRGLAAAPDARAWWILNPDTQPHAEALGHMLDRLGRGECDAVGCTLYRPNGRIQSHGGRWWSWMARPQSLGIGEPLAGEADATVVEGVQNYLNGASMLISRRFLEVAGPMREDYFLYCEEVEWCLRARTRGLRLGFAPAARVAHSQGTTTGAGGDPRRTPRLPLYLGERNKVLLTRDVFPGRLAVAALASAGLLVLRYGGRAAWRQLGYGLAGWWAGLRDKRGAPDWLAA